MSFTAKTNIGKVRLTNQDCYNTGIFSDGTYWAVVCDGMGGASGGEIAADMCCKTVSFLIEKGYRENMTQTSVKNLLQSAVITANIEINDTSKKDVSLKGMGTTVVAAIVLNGCAFIAHVGDSRAYILSDGNIKQITKDHSVVQYMIDIGKITPEEAKVHPDRNIITRAVGSDENVQVDLDFTEIKNGDKILICTDGLSGCVSDGEILKKSEEINTSSELCDKLINSALSSGGRDNITVAVSFC